MKKIFSFVIVVLFSAALFAETYTVAGSMPQMFGTTWDVTNTANDMVLNGTVYEWSKTGVELPAVKVEYKIIQDHDVNWTKAWPASNKTEDLAKSGKYDIKITFNPSDKSIDHVFTLKEEYEVNPMIMLHGNFYDAAKWEDTPVFAESADKKSASVKLQNLKARTCEFGIRIGGPSNWLAKGAEFTRTNASQVIKDEGENKNMKLTMDVDGDYTFTWTYDTNTLTITYPSSTGVENVRSDKVQCTKVLRDGQLYIIKNGETYTTQGQLVK